MLPLEVYGGGEGAAEREAEETHREATESSSKCYIFSPVLDSQLTLLSTPL